MAWRLIATLVVVGAVGAFAGYSFGSRDGAAPPAAMPTSPRGGHVYALRDGDVVLRRDAAVRCEASHEAGQRNLFCSRIGRGKHQVIFYRDRVLVWPLVRGPDGPPTAFDWQP